MLLITIVTYNPDESFVAEMIRRIREREKAKVLVIDNHSTKTQLTLVPKLADHFIQFDMNYGLGRAYNYAIKMAKEMGAEYVMFLDQDSKILDNFKPSKVVEEYNEVEKTVGIRTPILSVNLPIALIEGKIEGTNFYTAKWVVNSGMILETSYGLSQPFLEPLFLDRLDIEYCHRASILGNKILVYKDPMINHSPGESKKELSSVCGKILYLALRLLHHSEKDKEKYKYYLYYSNFLRYYLMLRNDIYLVWKYKFRFSFSSPGIVIGDILLLCEVIGFKKSLKWIMRAFKYGLSGKLDEDNNYILR